MKRKSGDYSGNQNKKFVPNSHDQMHPTATMGYSQMMQQPWQNMSAELAASASYYAQYSNYQCMMDPSYATYYQTVPPPMYHQPPLPPLPPDDSANVKPPLPPGMPPPGMPPPGMPPLGISPPQNNWNRKQNHQQHQQRPSTNIMYQRQRHQQHQQQQSQKSPQPPHSPGIKQPKKQPSPAGSMDIYENSSDEITVNKKAKRKPMSTRYTRKKDWDRDDAIKALELEKEYNQLQKLPMLILKFPDPELNKDIVKTFSPHIDNVHFQQPSTARFCYITLRPGTNLKEVENVISNITFGTGKISVKKHSAEEKPAAAPEEIDPYTLYIGNLPTTVTVAAVKEKFPTAQRIDIGFAQKMKYTRYAFIRYQTIEESTEAYRNTFNLDMDSRSLIVRFRRQKGNVGLPGEPRTQKPKMLIDETSQLSLSTDVFPDVPTDLDIFLDVPSKIPSPIQVAPELVAKLETPKATTDLIAKPIQELKAIINTIPDVPILTPPTPPSLLSELNDTVKIPDIEPILMPPEEADSKTNVIADAMKLMSEQKVINVDGLVEDGPPTAVESVAQNPTPSVSVVPDLGVRIKEEAIVNNENLDDLIIGTRVKEEPEDYENDYDEDESDDDMLDDDDDDDDDDMNDDKEEDDDDAALYDRFNHFDDLPYDNCEDKDEKPNIQELELLYGPHMDQTDENHQQSTSQKKSEYDDLFDLLNPNDNLEL